MTVLFQALYAGAVLVAVAAMLASCASDFRTMTIPNRYPVTIALAFVVAFGASLGLEQSPFAAFYMHSMALGLMLGLTFIMFAVKVWGAGDSKLASALSLWFGLQGFSVFLLVMALGGLALIAVGAVIRRLPDGPLWLSGPGSWPQRLKSGDRVLPYGIAIAAGGLAAFAERGYFGFFQIAGVDMPGF